MLYIRKDIDLNELEKFGFKHMIFLNKYRYIGDDTNIYVDKNRRISISNFIDGNIYDLNIIYDLIKNNIIERR